MKFKQIKNRVFEVVQVAKPGDWVSKVFDLSIILLIFINVCMVVLDTFTLPASFKSIFSNVEVYSVIIFTIEYVLRVWTSDLLYPSLPSWKARLKFIFSAMALIDLLAILPFYLPYIIPLDLRVLRLLRLVRLFRLFKVNRYTHALSQIAAVFKNRSGQLLSSMFVVFLLMVIASVIMYNVESPVQPDKFSNAFSGMWWAIATLTTVGYGDVYPVTVLGKVLSAIIAMLGIGLVAVPTGIISAGFMEQLDKDKDDAKDEKHYCPYCGKKID